jgi:hypothetical protein
VLSLVTHGELRAVILCIYHLNIEPFDVRLAVSQHKMRFMCLWYKQRHQKVQKKAVTGMTYHAEIIAISKSII